MAHLEYQKVLQEDEYVLVGVRACSKQVTILYERSEYFDQFVLVRNRRQD